VKPLLFTLLTRFWRADRRLLRPGAWSSHQRKTFAKQKSLRVPPCGEASIGVARVGT
jgi:hypothetical protein